VAGNTPTLRGAAIADVIVTAALILVVFFLVWFVPALW
jgi:hypothetical protein